MRQLVLRRPTRAYVMPVQHLSATEIAAYIDSTLSAEARAAADFHLSGCAQCREELASCLRLANSAPSRSPLHVSWPLFGSIAAAILIVAVIRPGRQRTHQEQPHERGATAPASSFAIAPANEGTVERAALRLVWRRDSAAVSYHAIITDSAGAPIWRSDDLTDTSVAPPSTTRLSPGARYFWRVDALHADGSNNQSASTGFRIKR